MITLHPSTRFKRSFKKIPRFIQEDFVEKIERFLKNPFERGLKTHKLKGKLGNYYVFCLVDGYRVLFDFVESDIALLVNIGDHNEYKKWGRS